MWSGYLYIFMSRLTIVMYKLGGHGVGFVGDLEQPTLLVPLGEPTQEVLLVLTEPQPQVHLELGLDPPP